MNLQSQAEQLITELQNKLKEVEQLESRERLIINHEGIIKTKFDELYKKEREITALKESLTQEKDFITRKLLELDKREDVLTRLVAQGEIIKKEKEELEAKRKEIALKDFDLKEAREQVKQDLIEIAKRESMVIKQTEVDRQRKAELDRQAEYNSKERERLQRIAMQYST